MIDRNMLITDLYQRWRTVTWFQWILVWVLGVVIGVPMMWLVYASGIGRGSGEAIRTIILAVAGADFQSFVIAERVSNLVIALVPGALVGAMVGVAQWYVLHRNVHIGHWVLMSILGGAVGWWVASAMFAPVNSAVAIFMRRTLAIELGSADIVVSAIVTGSVVGYLGGAIVGLTQWLALRRFVQFTGWWILVSAIGWSILWILGGGMFAILLLSSDRIVF